MTDNPVTKSVRLQIGGYSNLTHAQRDAIEFRLSDVFARRSGMFPNPVNFGLVINPIASVAHEWPASASPLNKFYVDLRLEVLN